VNKEDLYNCVAFFIYMQSTQTCASWVEQQVNFSHLHYRKAFLGEWNGYVLLFTSWTTGSFDALGGWSGYYYSTCTLVPSIHHLHLYFGTFRGQDFWGYSH